MGLLDELLDRYGSGAVVTVRPYVASGGETLRLILQIDGEEVPDMDVLTGEGRERPDVMVMLLVHGDEEVELARWHEDADNPFSLKAGAAYSKYGPPEVVWTVGGLRRHHQGA